MTTSLSDAGSIILGLSLVVVAGAANGSWNVSFRPTHGYAVGRPQNVSNPEARNNDKTSASVVHLRQDLEYHQAWILFQIYAVLLNIPVCLYWSGGPARVADIVRASRGVDIFLIVIFSLLWGVGSVGFGLACQVAGVGLGTNLCMGVIMVLGTFLPLCLEGTVGTAAGGVVMAGLKG